MYKLIVGFSFLLLLSSCSKRIIPIETLSSDKDVVDYIKKHERRERISLGSIKQWQYDTLLNYFDSVEFKNWFIADFDGNGLKDLLAKVVLFNEGGYGFSSYYLRLDKGAGKFERIGLTKLNQEYFIPLRDSQMFGIRRFRLNPVYEYYRQYVELKDSIKQPPFIEDTLVIVKDCVVEYNRSVRKYGIIKIEFKADSCDWSCPVFEMIIDSSGYGKYYAEKHNKLNGLYYAIIKKEKLNKIFTLLNYLDFPYLDDSYISSRNDEPLYTLSILYNNGSVKKIKDYGGMGSVGLEAIYYEFFKLRESQNWEKVKE